MWFAGYSASRPKYRRPIAGARKVVLRDIAALSSCDITCASFFETDPATSEWQPECIYADPPYAGTAGYDAVGAFDHDTFWRYCQLWASRGVRVFVSEYSCPIAADIVWSKAHSALLANRHAPRVEYLFRVTPKSLTSAA